MPFCNPWAQVLPVWILAGGSFVRLQAQFENAGLIEAVVTAV